LKKLQRVAQKVLWAETAQEALQHIGNILPGKKIAKHW